MSNKSSVHKILPQRHDTPLRRLERSLQETYRLQREIERLPKPERDHSKSAQQFRGAMYHLRELTIRGDEL